MPALRNWLRTIGPLERRKDGRVAARNLEILCGCGEPWSRARVKDISPLGIYLLTPQRWPPGALVHLIFDGQSPPFRRTLRPVKIVAKVARHGEDGVGLTFVRDEAHGVLWPKLIEVAASVTAPRDVAGLFRATKALEFLFEIHPAAEDQVEGLLQGWGRSERSEGAFEILLRAEEVLKSTATAIRSDLPFSLLLQILEVGSRAEDEALIASWGNLLASACTPGSRDQETEEIAESLASLLPVDLSILSAACRQALQQESAGESGAELFCSTDEIRAVTGLPTLATVEQHLHFLHRVGLLAKTVRAFGCDAMERANLTPTGRAMAFYRACLQTGEPVSKIRTAE